MDRIINTRLLLHPLNYLIVAVVVLIGMMALREIGRLYQSGQATLAPAQTR